MLKQIHLQLKNILGITSTQQIPFHITDNDAKYTVLAALNNSVLHFKSTAVDPGNKIFKII